MRVDKLYIEEFKNLKNFHIDFCEQELTSVLIGRNGAGKSNVIEALVIIFRDLDLKNLPSFGFKINYLCHNHDIQIIAKEKQYYIEVDGQKATLAKFLIEDDYGSKPYLPKHVFAYYSGPSNRLEKHFDKHQERFYRDLLDGKQNSLRPFFYARLIHSHFVLLSFFCFFDEKAKDFLKKYLDIVELESVLFVLKKPYWDKKKQEHKIDQFWGARGVVRDFLKDLYDYSLAPIKDSINISSGFSSKRNEVSYLYLKNEDTLVRFAEKYGNNIEFFKNLESTYLSDLIQEVRIRVVKSDGTKITFNELSEGEQQLITVLGLLKFTKNEESLFLLDEPDTHLNPAWKFEYLQLLKSVVGDSETSQVIISTHDPIVIGGLGREQVTIFTRGKDISTKNPEIDPKGMGVAALLTSELFGLTTTLDPDTQQKIDRKRELMYKADKTVRDEVEIQKLADELGSLDYTKTIRDPLYDKFVTAIFKREEFKKPVLTPEEIAEQSRIADQILDEILGEDKK